MDRVYGWMKIEYEKNKNRKYYTNFTFDIKYGT
jgi:hypothetical protein